MRRMPFGASCRLPICRLGRQRHPPQSGYRTRPYSVRRIRELVGPTKNEQANLILATVCFSLNTSVGDLTRQLTAEDLHFDLESPKNEAESKVCGLSLLFYNDDLDWRMQ